MADKNCEIKKYIFVSVHSKKAYSTLFFFYHCEIIFKQSLFIIFKLFRLAIPFLLNLTKFKKFQF